MIVCHDPQFVFIRNPKTASRSVTELLKFNFEVWEYSNPHEWRVPEFYSNFYTFMFVRNPFTRCVSAWKHVCRDWARIKKNEVLTFEDFIRIKVFRTSLLDKNFFKQSEIIKSVNVLKYENISEGLRTLPFIKGSISVPHIGRSEDSENWMDVYTPKTEKMVVDALSEDFETFGYSKKLSDCSPPKIRLI